MPLVIIHSELYLTFRPDGIPRKNKKTKNNFQKQRDTHNSTYPDPPNTKQVKNRPVRVSLLVNRALDNLDPPDGLPETQTTSHP
jgi:hypothetical protein